MEENNAIVPEIKEVFVSAYKLPSKFNKDKVKETIKLEGIIYYLINVRDLDPKRKYIKRYLHGSISDEHIVLYS